MIAIGGGGYVPARILRSFLKQPGSPNIPIQAIGLSLYESLTTDVVEAPGTKVTRTQWLDLTALGEMEGLIGKRILIVDEVDDTRTTLEYAVRELEKDVEIAREKLGGEKAQFSIFVLHVSVFSFFAANVALERCKGWRIEADRCMNNQTEQGQAKEGHSPRGDHQGPLQGSKDRWRRLDLLPVGSDGYRRA